jgi:hypothetical protein
VAAPASAGALSPVTGSVVDPPSADDPSEGLSPLPSLFAPAGASSAPGTSVGTGTSGGVTAPPILSPVPRSLVAVVPCNRAEVVPECCRPVVVPARSTRRPSSARAAPSEATADGPGTTADAELGVSEAGGDTAGDAMASAVGDATADAMGEAAGEGAADGAADAKSA